MSLPVHRFLSKGTFSHYRTQKKLRFVIQTRKITTVNTNPGTAERLETSLSWSISPEIMFEQSPSKGREAPPYAPRQMPRILFSVSSQDPSLFAARRLAGHFRPAVSQFSPCRCVNSQQQGIEEREPPQAEETLKGRSRCLEASNVKDSLTLPILSQPHLHLASCCGTPF